MPLMIVLEEFLVRPIISITKNPFKGCLSLFNYSIDMSPTLMSPFFVKKHVFEGKKHVFFNKKWTHTYKIII